MTCRWFKQSMSKYHHPRGSIPSEYNCLFVCYYHIEWWKWLSKYTVCWDQMWEVWSGSICYLSYFQECIHWRCVKQIGQWGNHFVDSIFSDYVGEIISTEGQTIHLWYPTCIVNYVFTSLSFRWIRTSKHIGLNYCFELNSTIVLDAARIGNETRYLNHSKDGNCESRGSLQTSLIDSYWQSVITHPCISVRLVNGEHRIGLFAGGRYFAPVITY